MTKRTKAPAPAPAPAPDAKTLQVEKTPGKTRERMLAAVATQGLASNAAILSDFTRASFGELSLTAAVAELRDSAAAVSRGDLAGPEAMLAAQAVSLNAMFAEMARRASLNMGQYMGAAETYMRLALKAQGQCRATLETLAAIKNPPVVFARQANINHGGQQQVNNGTALQAGGNAPAPAPAAQGEGGTQSLEAPVPGTTHSATQGIFRPLSDIQAPEPVGARQG